MFPSLDVCGAPRAIVLDVLQFRGVSLRSNLENFRRDCIQCLCVYPLFGMVVPREVRCCQIPPWRVRVYEI